MATRIETAIAAGLAKIKSLAGVPVTLSRGAAATSITQAIRGASMTEVTDSNGQRMRIVRRDYLIDAADYQVSGVAVEPAIGDEITDDGEVYEVAPLGSGDTPWRWSDRQHVRYRIHTVEK